MNCLVDELTNLSIHSHPTWFNNSNYELYCLSKGDEDYVYTGEDIPGNEIIAFIEGFEKEIINNYIPNKYCIRVDDFSYIDCTETPRCIASMIREGFYEGLEANCCLKISTSNLATFIYVQTLKDIYRGEELIIYRDL